MKATCQNCQCCYAHHEVNNAHTIFEIQEGKVTFSSTDDDFGIDVCQVCYKPPLLARLWHKIFGQHNVAPESNMRTQNYPEIAVAKL